MNVAAPQKQLSVLILEDDPLDRELTEIRLRQTGYACDLWTASGRQEFLDRFGERPYDLILADFSLPDFDGLSALDIVRAKDRDVPFIIVSGALGEELAVESLHRGATDYVLKQRLERLVPAIARALNEYFEHHSRMQAESLLRQSELRFQQMANALPALLWTADRQGNFLYRNRAWAQYFGALEGPSWCDKSFMHLDDLSHVTRDWRDALKDGSPMECACRLQRADGTYRWHLVRIVPLESGSPNSGWIGTCTDIETQRKQEELLRLSEKVAVIGRMAGAIAHEINNPLESLSNLLYLLRDKNTNAEPGSSYLAEANNQLVRIASITKQTLLFYRDKASLGDVDCRMLIDETLILFRAKLIQKNIQIHISAGDQTRFQARTGEIRQVLINLISNAVDAMDSGGVLTLRARRDNLNDSSGQVFVEVEDTGHGITDEARPRLFEPFFSTKGTLGTGLGLWVVQNIVHRHRGSINITSNSGGTLISVAFPQEYRGD